MTNDYSQLEIALMGEVIDYVMEMESDDFYENPSSNHIYYKAMVLHMGRIYANLILIDAENLVTEEK